MHFVFDGAVLPIKAEENLLSYAKIDDNEISVIIFNNRDNNQPEDIKIDVWMLGIKDGSKMKIVFRSNVASSSVSETDVNTGKSVETIYINILHKFLEVNK